MAKDRQVTEQRLLQAVGNIVREKGFSALGVNAVAQQAGVSKMLIYRYFDSYEGLLKEWILRHNFWAEVTGQTLEQIRGQSESGTSRTEQQYGSILRSLFNQQADSLRESSTRREVLRWMLAEETEVSRQVMQQVEEMGLSISKAFRARISSERDLEAAVGVLIGGIYYLALISDRTDVFNGVDLHSDEGWSRIKGSIDLMIELLVGNKEFDKKSKE